MAALARASAWVALLCAMSNIELATVDILDGNTCEIDVYKAADINAPHIRCGPWTPKRQNAAYGTEVVFRDLCVPLIKGQLVDRRKEPERVTLDSMKKRASAAANRAIARAHVIEFSVDLELDLAAMTTPAVRLFHGALGYSSASH